MSSRLRGRLPSRRTPGLVLQYIRTHGQPPPDLDFVTGTLAVGGGFGSVRQVRTLAGLGITAVVSLSLDAPEIESELKRQGAYLHLPTPDCCPPAAEDLRAGAAWVRAEIARGGKVLVHCQRGMGRSVILAAAVLLELGYTWQAALDLIKSKRKGASPLRAQVAALRRFAQMEAAS